jgi:hypothetical protein
MDESSAVSTCDDRRLAGRAVPVSVDCVSSVTAPFPAVVVAAAPAVGLVGGAAACGRFDTTAAFGTFEVCCWGMEGEGAVAGAVCSIVDSLWPGGPSSTVAMASTRVAGSQRPSCGLMPRFRGAGFAVPSLCLTRQLATYLLRLLASGSLPGLDAAKSRVSESHNPGNGTGTRGPLNARWPSKTCAAPKNDGGMERIKIVIKKAHRVCRGAKQLRSGVWAGWP